MDIVLQIKSEDLNKVRDLLMKDEIVSRASMVFKEGSGFGVEGYVCYISGVDEYCKRALEIVKAKDEAGNITALAEEIESKKAQEIIKRIKDEEDRALEGFGALWG